MRVEILAAEPAHAAGIRELDGLSPASRRLLAHDLDATDRCCLVAQVDDEVVGYAAAMVVLDEAHVIDVAVATGWRRRGIGRALLEALDARLVTLGVAASTLEVRRDNEAALALYRQLGFAVEGERVRYYPDGEDALLLWRRT